MTETDERLFGPGPSHGDVIVYCLPDAGSGASAFGGWQRKFPQGIEIRPLHLPGRESRFREPWRIAPVEIARAIAGRTDRPFALYGHSMGGRLAFEVVRELRRHADAPLPVALYVGASAPPDVPVPLAEAVELPDDELVAELISRAGAGQELRDLPELRELVLPVIRADLGWVRSYRYRPEPPLPVPVLAFAGTDDREYGKQQMLGWARHTGVGFRVHTVPGGHAFHRATPDRLVNLLTVDLLGRISP